MLLFKNWVRVKETSRFPLGINNYTLWSTFMNPYTGIYRTTHRRHVKNTDVLYKSSFNVLFLVIKYPVEQAHNAVILWVIKSRKSTERSILYAVQRQLGQAIRDVFGHNVFRRMGTDITRQTVYSASSQMMNGLL